jgi:DNA-binding CsgD family transcriptional regulator/PAS domain-containing protein
LAAGQERVPEQRDDYDSEDVLRMATRTARTEGSPAPFVSSILDTSGQGAAEVESALQALLECGEEVAQTGSWDWHLDTDQLRLSDNLYRIFGLDPGGTPPTPQYLIERVHPDDRERVELAVEAARRQGRLRPLDCRFVRPEGETRHLHATQAVPGQGEGRHRRIVGSVQDLTDRRRVEGLIAAHVAVSESLSEWQTLDQGATGLLRSLAEGFDCVGGVLWLPEGDVLAAHASWSSGSIDVSELESVIRQLRLPRGVGLAGRVWELGEPLLVSSLEDDPRFPVQAVAGLHGALAVPASHGQEMLAVLEFYFCEPAGADVTARLVRSLAGIGYELGLFLAHRRGDLKPSSLTPREHEVLQLAAEGCAGREIAERLGVSPATVRRHFEHIYAKYEVSDRAAAVAKGLREGLIE